MFSHVGSVAFMSAGTLNPIREALSPLGAGVRLGSMYLHRNLGPKATIWELLYGPRILPKPAFGHFAWGSAESSGARVRTQSGLFILAQGLFPQGSKQPKLAIMYNYRV